MRRRLFAEYEPGEWFDLNEIIEGERLDAETACARAALRTGRPVNAEPITDKPEQDRSDGEGQLRQGAPASARL